MLIIKHMRAEEQEQQDREKAEQIIAAIPRMPEISKIDVELYTDHTGDPSFQLVFHVRSGVAVDKEFITRFNRYTATVQTGILHSDLNRFPYTRLKQAA